MATSADPPITLCRSDELVEGGPALAFELYHAGQPCRAFAIRYRGLPQAYLNRCTHVAMEMDYQPGRFFDDSGQWLLCATHGAAYQPETGACAGGPCRGGLLKIALSENEGLVRWHTAPHLQARASAPQAAAATPEQHGMSSNDSAGLRALRISQPNDEQLRSKQ